MGMSCGKPETCICRNNYESLKNCVFKTHFCACDLYKPSLLCKSSLHNCVCLRFEFVCRRHMFLHTAPQNFEDCCICCISYGKNAHVVEMKRCKHRYHFGCLKMWFKRKHSCPLCGDYNLSRD